MFQCPIGLHHHFYGRVSTFMCGHLSCFNALSGYIIISTRWHNDFRSMTFRVSMPYRATSSFLPEATHRDCLHQLCFNALSGGYIIISTNASHGGMDMAKSFNALSGYIIISTTGRECLLQCSCRFNALSGYIIISTHS